MVVYEKEKRKRERKKGNRVLRLVSKGRERTVKSIWNASRERERERETSFSTKQSKKSLLSFAEIL